MVVFYLYSAHPHFNATSIILFRESNPYFLLLKVKIDHRRSLKGVLYDALFTKSFFSISDNRYGVSYYPRER